MADAKLPDPLDRLLTGYFRPEAVPPGLARRVVAAARTSEADFLRLERSLAIQATPRGVCLIRAGRPEAGPASAGASRSESSWA